MIERLSVMNYDCCMTYSKFEDIPVWQESRLLVKKVYDLISKTKSLGRDFSLSDQLKRAAYSVMLNIAEGFERGSNTEFAHYLNIAKGSAGEVRAILYIALDNGYIQIDIFNSLVVECKELSIHLANFRKFLIVNKARKK